MWENNINKKATDVVFLAIMSKKNDTTTIR